MKNTNYFGILGIGLMAYASVLNYSNGEYGWMLGQVTILVAIGITLVVGNKNKNKWRIK